MPHAKIRAQQAANSTALAWGFGGVSVGIKNNLLGVWILYYYSEVLGVDAYLVALALAVALGALELDLVGGHGRELGESRGKEGGVRVARGKE